MNAKKNQRQARPKLPMRVYLGYLLVITLVFSGVTFSKYIASTDAGDSARVAAFGDLVMTENNKPEKFIITPGVKITKNPQVSFGVKEPSEMAVYVFVSIEADGWQYKDGAYQIARGNDSEPLLNWSVDSNWEFLETDGNQQVFYRTVPANESLTAAPVIANGEIEVSEELLASDYDELKAAEKSITFHAYAVQIQGFDGAGAAWDSVSSK